MHPNHHGMGKASRPSNFHHTRSHRPMDNPLNNTGSLSNPDRCPSLHHNMDRYHSRRPMDSPNNMDNLLSFHRNMARHQLWGYRSKHRSFPYPSFYSSVHQL